MGYQVLQVKDELGDTYDLGVTTPDTDVAIRNYDPAVHSVILKRFGVTQGSAQLINTSGDNTVVTPTSGKSIRLKWFSMATSESNGAEVVVTVKLGSTVLYMWPMGAPAAFAHGSVREGGVNDPLVVNLSIARGVYVNYEFEEF